MFCLRDGSALWSNASSVDGRKCGEAYEWEVSEKFQHVGLEKPESISVGVTSDQLQGWKNMKSEADRLTKEIVGESTHSRITSKFPDKETKGGPEQANRATGAADLEGRVNGQISLRERLGSSAEILFGGDVISGNVVVEVSVMSALLLMKMAQLERYFQLRQLYRFFEYLEKIELYCSKENHNLGFFRARTRKFRVVILVLAFSSSENLHYKKQSTTTSICWKHSDIE